jgi:hypothetical protein
MRSGTIGSSTRELLANAINMLKRFWKSYQNGGFEDDWGFAVVSEEVIDINTKMPISGNVMRKVVDGRWVYRQMTDEEREDFDASRRW